MQVHVPLFSPRFLRWPLAVTLTIALLAVSTVRADEITEQIDSALEAYKQQDYQSAIGDLNYAVAQLQELVNTQNAGLLPEPLEGWEAGDVENVGAAMAMLGGGTSMTRTYSRGGESIEINITANSPWVATMMQMMANPMLMAGNPDLKPYRYKRIKGMKEKTPDQTEVSLMLAGQVMVKVTGRGLADDAVIEQYLDAMDFDRIQQSLVP